MSDHFEIPVGDPQQTASRAEESMECDYCHNQADFIADNNEAGIAYAYCGTCEDNRATKYGCARIMAEGCGCFPGPEECACGCGGTGQLE